MVDLLKSVRLPDPEDQVKNYPHQLSGGMRQRVCAAMALAGDPAILIADEPTTALDVTVEASFLDLLVHLWKERSLSIIFVTHDFSIIRRICDRVAVMYAGRVVESGPVEEVLDRPGHPYTKALIASDPTAVQEGRVIPIKGDPPDPSDRQPGCAFHPRCEYRQDRCLIDDPPLYDLPEAGHSSACHYRETVRLDA